MIETKLSHWKARRSGDGLSLTGTDTHTGKERVITGIKLIASEGHQLLATGPTARIVLKV